MRADFQFSASQTRLLCEWADSFGIGVDDESGVSEAAWQALVAHYMSRENRGDWSPGGLPLAKAAVNDLVAEAKRIGAGHGIPTRLCINKTLRSFRARDGGTTQAPVTPAAPPRGVQPVLDLYTEICVPKGWQPPGSPENHAARITALKKDPAWFRDLFERASADCQWIKDRGAANLGFLLSKTDQILSGEFVSFKDKDPAASSGPRCKYVSQPSGRRCEGNGDPFCSQHRGRSFFCEFDGCRNCPSNGELHFCDTHKKIAPQNEKSAEI